MVRIESLSESEKNIEILPKVPTTLSLTDPKGAGKSPNTGQTDPGQLKAHFDWCKSPKKKKKKKKKKK